MKTTNHTEDMTNTEDLTSLRERIATRLKNIKLVHGIGESIHHTACSISALNLELTGELTDELQPCMSPVVHRLIIPLQDAMPEEMMSPATEHGRRWRALLPLIAGSADPEREESRRAIILEWMWERLAWKWRAWVPSISHDAWERMLIERTEEAAAEAVVAVAKHPAERIVAEEAAEAVAAVARATEAAGSAVAAAVAAGWRGRRAVFWTDANPAALLERLVA